MKKDIDLTRRIRGERFKDHRDHQPKIGNEVFYQLPYYEVKEQRRYLKEYVSKGGPPYKNGDYFAALYM